MIFVDEESPRWLKELARFLPLKSLLFVHGNIYDLMSYPVKHPTTGEVFWTESDLLRFFERFLVGQHYEVVGILDPVDGLLFTAPVMAQPFQEAQTGQSPREEGALIRQPETISQPGPAVTAIPRTPSLPASSETLTGQGGAASEAAERSRKPQPSRRGGIDLNPQLDSIRSCMRNTRVPCAFIINLASRLVTSPTHLNPEERTIFTKILKASLESVEVYRQDEQWRNVLVVVCDKINDMPAFLYLNNPRARSVYVEKPDTLDRSRFARRHYRYFHNGSPDSPPPSEEFVAQFAALTEGLTHYELKSLVSLSRCEEIPLNNISKLCERYKFGVTESEWDKITQARLEKSEEFLRSRIKGQDLAIARVLDIIKRARMGLAAGAGSHSHRPRGILFFAGPTGVGKTEMAKSLAELLFGQEDRCLRFDMSEYSAPHADQRLLGAPPGYVGYDAGGQLTNALKEKPFSVLLFDEIEKAHGSIFDKFLQILDDGRLTDGQGETVYFSESIIIFTSNLGTKELVNPEKPYPPYLEMQDTVLREVRDHFNFVLRRPEILNRFGENFVVFDFIRPPVDEAILDMLISRLLKTAQEERKIEVKVSAPVREALLVLARQCLQHGGRGIRNVVDAALVNPLNRLLFDQGLEPGARVNLTGLVDHGPEAPYRFVLENAT